MRVIIIHHILWAHYKNAFYEELQNQAKLRNDLTVNILQIARSERSREEMPLKFQPQYEYQLLFDAVFEDIPKSAIFKRILAEIKSFKPDVVNVNGFFTWYYILTIAYCKLMGIKVILSNDSTASDNPKVWWKSVLKRFAVSISDGYYTFGTKSAAYLLDYGADNNKILSKRGAVVNNNFIRKAYEEALPNKPTLMESLGIKTQKNFIFVGRFIDFKNLPTLLNAFKKAQDLTQKETWGLLFLGDGTLAPQLKQQVEKMQIQDVQFLGGKSWHEVPEFLTLADVLILPSKSEPWGLVVNEAMICGLPVVVSERCGSAIDLVIEGVTGFAFNHQDEEQLSQILLKFMNETVDYQALSNDAKKKIADFSVENAAMDMINGFYEVSK
jgi:glycosyltransferase involved in cell wall biosynthesis